MPQLPAAQTIQTHEAAHRVARQGEDQHRRSLKFLTPNHTACPAEAKLCERFVRLQVSASTTGTRSNFPADTPPLRTTNILANPARSIALVRRGCRARCQVHRLRLGSHCRSDQHGPLLLRIWPFAGFSPIEPAHCPLAVSPAVAEEIRWTTPCPISASTPIRWHAALRPAARQHRLHAAKPRAVAHSAQRRRRTRWGEPLNYR